MNADRWQTVERLYRAAQQRRPEERSAFLDGACHDDPEMRREIDALLANATPDNTVTMAAQAVVGPGFELGHYRIESKLGEGGMGSVYRALDTLLNRPVAIKFLNAELADPAARRRFQDEARMASSLNHPHILTVHEAGEFEGRQFLVTEFVDGGTLKDWVKQEKRAWKQTVELLLGVADGLAAAHDAKILHRDIKPANILVGKNGYAKLGDFGLAKLSEGAAADGATQKGMIVGTIAYMSPEQASGQTLDARSDIFSFGVVLHEMLSGRRPFNAKSDLELLKTIIHAEPEPLSEEIPQALRAHVEKALEKDPAERYQTMRDLVVDLRRTARRRTPDAVKEAMPVAALKRRNRWVPWAATVSTIVAVGLWLAFRPAAGPYNPLDGATYNPFTDFPGDESSASISPDGKFVVFIADRDGPDDAFVGQVGSTDFRNLTNGTLGGRRSVGFANGGSDIWFGGGPLSQLRITQLMGGTARPFLHEKTGDPDSSPDGKKIVYFEALEGDNLLVADRDGTNPQPILTAHKGEHNHAPRWSPDGQWIYFQHGMIPARDMDVWRIAPTGGQPERLTNQGRLYNTHLTMIDARTVLFVAQDQDGFGPWLWSLDVPSKVTRRISSGLQKYLSISASADGRHLVASVAIPTASLSSVSILDHTAAESEVQPYRLSTAWALAPRFGGNSLFYLSSHGAGNSLWRSDNRQPAVEVWKEAEGALLETPAVSPDTKQVAISVRKNGKQSLRIIGADGTEIRSLTEAIDIRGSASWSPEGKWIAVGGKDSTGEEGLFKIPTDGGPPESLAKGFAANPVWSPKNDVVVYAGVESAGELPLLAVRPDGSAFELPLIRVRPAGERVRFLPDGKGLIYMQGSLTAQDFWLLDLTTKQPRRLTQFSDTATMRTFDITRDGKQIVFDRLRENSNLMLIDLPKKP